MSPLPLGYYSTAVRLVAVAGFAPRHEPLRAPHSALSNIRINWFCGLGIAHQVISALQRALSLDELSNRNWYPDRELHLTSESTHLKLARLLFRIGHKMVQRKGFEPHLIRFLDGWPSGLATVACLVARPPPRENVELPLSRIFKFAAACRWSTRA